MVLATKCLVRLVVDLSKAGRPAPQKKPRTKAKPFQNERVSHPSRARRMYFKYLRRAQSGSEPLQTEKVFAFARPLFEVLVALRSTGRRRVEQDIL